MARLLIHVEGQTEEIFVRELLRNHLLSKGYEEVSARLLGNARLKHRRGGIRSWPSARKDIVSHLKEDPNAIATTMVDYYGLPQEGDAAWPGRAGTTSLSADMKARRLETALLDDVSTEMGKRFNRRRFVPFVVMHEFEGLLFSDCARFANGIERPGLHDRLRQIRDQFDTPEEINDSPVTAPSKRVLELVPEYQKPLFGALAALEVGLDSIRRECTHVRHWLEELESRVP